MTSAAAASIDRPIFIVSSPRAGSTLLFETMIQTPGVYTTGRESHKLIEKIEGLHPRDNQWVSNRLTAAHATPDIVEKLSGRFYRRLHDRDGTKASGRVRMIEKTPKNSLRIPFFRAAYPDARFLYLYRDARPTLSSMLEAWKSGDFSTYPKLVWPRDATPWALLLVPGWRDLKSRSLQEIVAHQWTATTEILLDDLNELPAEDVASISYSEFLKSPQATLERVCAKFDLGWDRVLDSPLPLSKTTVSTPSDDKWRKNEAIIAEVWPIVEAVDLRAREALERFSA